MLRNTKVQTAALCVGPGVAHVKGGFIWACGGGWSLNYHRWALSTHVCHELLNTQRPPVESHQYVWFYLWMFSCAAVGLCKQGLGYARTWYDAWFIYNDVLKTICIFKVRNKNAYWWSIRMTFVLRVLVRRVRQYRRCDAASLPHSSNRWNYATRCHEEDSPLCRGQYIGTMLFAARLLVSPCRVCVTDRWANVILLPPQSWGKMLLIWI